MKPWGRAILATLLVAVLPVATVWALWALGVVTSVWIAAPLVIALVLLASIAGGAYWKRRPAAGDVLFSELLLWGWLRRARAERRAADAVELLRRAGADDDRAKLRLLTRLASALDAKDPYLDGHSRRVAHLSSLMADRLGVSHDEADRIRTAAAIHDVGKLHVPPDLLTKPDRLTSGELEVMRRHADEGAALVACLGDPSLSAVVRHHHERFDGAGYPAGLMGEAIPLGARIVAVADTFDAITSARPYRPAGTHKAALDVLNAEAGGQLDPVVVRAFVGGYSRRRGLALWALLALPIARAGRQPLPLGLVLGGILVMGAAATAVEVGNAGPDLGGAPATAQSLPVQIAAPAAAVQGHRPAHRKAHAARSARVRRAAFVVTGTGQSTPAVLTAGRRRGTAKNRHQGATQPRDSARPRGTASPRRAPQPTPTPRRKPHPAAPTPTAAPPRTPPTPAAASPQPTAQPTPSTTPPASAPTPPPVVTSAEQCKKGGYAALGYRNQGQCVSSQHGP